MNRKHATMLIVAGLTIGSLGAKFMSSAAKEFLFRIEVDDPRVFTVALAVLTVAALVATVIPAWRASRVDPAITLRAE